MNSHFLLLYFLRCLGNPVWLCFCPLHPQTILIQNIYRNPQNSAQTADASRCKLILSLLTTQQQMWGAVSALLRDLPKPNIHSVGHRLSPNPNKKHLRLPPPLSVLQPCVAEQCASVWTVTPKHRKQTSVSCRGQSSRAEAEPLVQVSVLVGRRTYLNHWNVVLVQHHVREKFFISILTGKFHDVSTSQCFKPDQKHHGLRIHVRKQPEVAVSQTKT